ncbi:YtxH domain-containing protein [Arthrobacter sp. B0490]|uniref:YtxH domain-containing protein n=1 Tax=Arthrobacter sp. B0490 TaxID=2058891 RepID=UPI0011B052B3|nr:YtxH domain-containing protein [Arthrobacter sp. B0490]
MKNKLVFAAGMAAGYVLGTRAGRESYEQLRSKAQKLWNDPKVQDKVSSTTDTLKSKAPAVQDSLKGVLKKGGSSKDGAKSPDTPGKDIGASGDLPLDVPPVVTAMDAGSTGTAGTTGPSGGDPRHVEDTPFGAQDEDTRPDLKG